MTRKEAERDFAQASALYRAKRYAEALQLLDALDSEQPFNKDVMYPRALCLAAVGRTGEALQVCDSLVALHQDPRASELRNRLRSPAAQTQVTGAAASGRSKVAPRSMSKGLPFSPRAIGLVLGGLVVVAAIALALRYVWLPATSKGEPAKTAQSEEVNAAQQAIDQAMRRQMETGPDPPFAVLYDTGTSSSKPLMPNEITARTGWTKIEDGKTDYSFKGDAVIMNNQIVVVLRKSGNGAELCGRSAGFQKTYANLVPMGVSTVAQTLDSVAISQCAQDDVVLDATYKTTGTESLKVRYDLAMGQVTVKATPIAGTTKLRVEAPCRFAVMPDFFADDIVVDAHNVLENHAELPSENFLLHMLGDGEAIAMVVWNNGDQDVQASFAESGGRQLRSSEIAFGKGGAVWVSLLAAKGIWHVRDVKASEKGKEVPLAWQRPFPALWRVDWRRTDNLTDSWEMLTETSPGHFKKHGLFEEEENSWTAEDWWGDGERTRIASGLGRFHYPCWVDVQGNGWFQPLAPEPYGAYSPLKGTPDFQGPAIVYPLNRLASTPLDKFTVVDVVRSSLGVGPCQYILDIEGQHEAFAGKPTCTVKEILDEIYEKGEQKQRHEDVEKALDDVVAFIALIRGRIDKYQTFAQDMRAFLQESEKKDPGLAPYVQETETLTERIDNAVAEHKDAIKSVDYAKDLAKKFRSELADYTGADALQKCQQYTDAWVDIGGNQDTLVAECRVAVKMLRQSPAASLSQNPQRAEFVRELRAKTESILRAPVNYEAPRH